MGRVVDNIANIDGWNGEQARLSIMRVNFEIMSRTLGSLPHIARRWSGRCGSLAEGVALEPRRRRLTTLGLVGVEFFSRNRAHTA